MSTTARKTCRFVRSSGILFLLQTTQSIGCAVVVGAVVAQSAERRTRNAQVKGSTPFNGSKGDLFCEIPFSFGIQGWLGRWLVSLTNHYPYPASPALTCVAKVAMSMLAPQTITPTRRPRRRSRKGPHRAAVAVAPAGSTANFMDRNSNAMA